MTDETKSLSSQHNTFGCLLVPINEPNAKNANTLIDSIDLSRPSLLVVCRKFYMFGRLVAIERPQEDHGDDSSVVLLQTMSLTHLPVDDLLPVVLAKQDHR